MFRNTRARVSAAVALVLVLGTAAFLPTRAEAIYGGQDAPSTRYPFFALVLVQVDETRFAFICGGSLVNSEWVLTAAHCPEAAADQPLKVLVGVTHVDGTVDGEFHDVTSVVSNPGFDDLAHHDEALLRLDDRSRLRPLRRVRPETAALAAAGTPATAIGFGDADPADGDDHIVIPPRLQETSIDIVDNSTCTDFYGPGFSGALGLCSGTPATGVCQGDSGGPLLVADGRDWFAEAGVVSGGPFACNEAPAVFSRVTADTSWIDSVIGTRQATWTTQRRAGTTRYETAAAISQAAFPGQASEVFVASGENFPDALAAGPLAGEANAPLLLTARSTLPEATRAELVRLAPAKITLVGGSGVVTDGVKAALEAIAPVTRVAGTDRYDTATTLAATRFEGSLSTVYVATGLNFPDALAAGPAAGRAGGAVLLTTPDELAPSVSAFLEAHPPSRIVVVGSSGVVSDAVVTALGSFGPVTRLAGPNRYDTAAELTRDAFPDDVDTAYVATGANFPDALAAVPAAVSTGSPLLLVAPDRGTGPALTQLYRLRANTVELIGAEQVLSDTNNAELRDG